MFSSCESLKQNDAVQDKTAPRPSSATKPEWFQGREIYITTVQVLALRRLIEGVKQKNLTAVITFVEFKKAFDLIHRGKLMKILRAYGIPAKIVQSISDMYSNTSAKVISPDGETDTFTIRAGVLQGDNLAPSVRDCPRLCPVESDKRSRGRTLIHYPPKAEQTCQSCHNSGPCLCRRYCPDKRHGKTSS